MKALYLDKPGIPEALIRKISQIPGLELDIVDDWSEQSSEEILNRIREYDILLLSRAPQLSAHSAELADHPGHLKYICYMHGGLTNAVGLPIIQSPITVTNWGDHPGEELAFTSLVLLFALLKDLPSRMMSVRRGEKPDIASVGGTVKGLRVGVYGYGFAGKSFVKLLLPLGADVCIYDPYAQDIPADCTQVDSLEGLFEDIHCLGIHAAWTPETEKSITAALLARLPDQGVVINTARGAIIDQDALFAELKSGRLRAGLDVLHPDHLPENHEARQWENLIWTGHRGGKTVPWAGEDSWTRRDEVVLENVRAFVEGRPLHYVIDEKRYALMT